MEFFLNFPEKTISGSKFLEILEVNDRSSFDQIDVFIQRHQGTPILCYLSYDLKSVINNTPITNKSKHNFPLALFVAVDESKKEFNLPTPKISELDNGISFIPETEYANHLKKIKDHIQRGDIYETNFCVEPTIEGKLDFRATFSNLMANNSAPFNAFLEYKNQYLLCSSPERFLKRDGNKLISQPIKGTIGRGNTASEDNAMQKRLISDPKETAENIMIVDLVRNDLSIIAERNSVQVEKLNEIQTFKTVHQLVSTISCQISEEIQFSDILKATFPMGSMTGAPKRRAMELMEDYESFQRGMYSGSIGYIDENGNFDLNVVIRSILYNGDTETTSFPVGGAITNASIPEKEYEECQLKAKSMIKSLVREI